MALLRTILNACLDEGKALPDGTEVTRKDGRIFKKVSGQWVYQRRASEKGSSDDQPEKPFKKTPPPKEKAAPKEKTPPKKISLADPEDSESPEGYQERMEIWGEMDPDEVMDRTTFTMRDPWLYQVNESVRRVMNKAGMADLNKVAQELLEANPEHIKDLAQARGVVFHYFDEKKLDRWTDPATSTTFVMREGKLKPFMKRRVENFVKLLDKRMKAVSARLKKAGLDNRGWTEGEIAAFMDLPKAETYYYLDKLCNSETFRHHRFDYSYDEDAVRVKRLTPTEFKEKEAKRKLEQKEKEARIKARNEWNALKENENYKKLTGDWKKKLAEHKEKHKVPTFSHVSEAHEWAKKTYPNVEWDLDGTHIDTLQPVLQQFHSLAQMWPEAMKKFKYFGTHSKTPTSISQKHDWSKDSNTYARANNEVIYLNPSYYGDPSKIREAIKKDMESGYHPKGDDGPETILTHEFGHTMDFWMDGNDGGALPHFDYDRHGRFGDLQRRFRQTHKPTNDLSTYALTNEREAWAESFTALHHQDPKDWTPYTWRQFRWLQFLEKNKGNKDYYNNSLAGTTKEKREHAKRIKELEDILGFDLLKEPPAQKTKSRPKKAAA